MEKTYSLFWSLSLIVCVLLLFHMLTFTHTYLIVIKTLWPNIHTAMCTHTQIDRQERKTFVERKKKINNINTSMYSPTTWFQHCCKQQPHSNPSKSKPTDVIYAKHPTFTDETCLSHMKNTNIFSLLQTSEHRNICYIHIIGVVEL